MPMAVLQKHQLSPVLRLRMTLRCWKLWKLSVQQKLWPSKRRGPGVKRSRRRQRLGATGFGKQLSQAELDAYLFSKGKGKGFKGKSKDQFSTYWDEPGMYSSDLMAFQKGKKGHFKGKGKTSANVYGLDFNFLEPYSSTLYPLELYTSADLHPPSHVMPEGCGMLDCGATASAGPEASVKKLISSLCRVDEHLGVSLDTSRRPFFRYGSGRWGQALYQVEITSSKQPQKSFRVFALPNPDEYYQKTFEDYMLVPILVGMDYLAKVGLILDFSDGHALHGADPLSEPFVMNKNAKGHYMVDIAQYLCGQSVPPSQVTSSPAAGSAFHLQADAGWGEWYELSMTVMNSTPNSYKKASPVDPDRKTLQDLQDPRSEVSCWPCKGKHTPSINGGNASGTWVKCSVCALRVQYTPRAGSPGSSTMKADQTFVKGALEFLQSEMRADQLPNYKIVEQAYALMECQDRLIAARNRVKDLEREYQSMHQTLLDWVKEPSAPKIPQKASVASRPSQADEIFQHLTPEEVEQLTHLAKGRMAPETPIHEVEDEDVEVVENQQDR
eukprot:s50_g7.t2